MIGERVIRLPYVDRNFHEFGQLLFKKIDRLSVCLQIQVVDDKIHTLQTQAGTPGECPQTFSRRDPFKKQRQDLCMPFRESVDSFHDYSESAIKTSSRTGGTARRSSTCPPASRISDFSLLSTS